MAFVVTIKVVPLSPQVQWKKEGDRLKVWLKSAPEKGKANSELVSLLTKILKISGRNIVIVSGATVRLKRLSIDAEITFDQFLDVLGIDRQISLF